MYHSLYFSFLISVDEIWKGLFIVLFFSVIEFHEPCENLQIRVPQGNGKSAEPKVRYHSGSECVDIMDSALWSIFDSLPSESNSGKAADIRNENQGIDETKQNDNAKSSERIYDDVDIDEYGIMRDDAFGACKMDSIGSKVFEENDNMLKTEVTEDALVQDEDTSILMRSSVEVDNETEENSNIKAGDSMYTCHDDSDDRSDLTGNVEKHRDDEESDDESENIDDVIFKENTNLTKPTMIEFVSGCDSFKTDNQIAVDVKDEGSFTGNVDFGDDVASTQDTTKTNTESKTTAITEHGMLSDQSSCETGIGAPAYSEMKAETASTVNDDKTNDETDLDLKVTENMKENSNLCTDDRTSVDIRKDEKGLNDDIQFTTNERVDCGSLDRKNRNITGDKGDDTNLDIETNPKIVDNGNDTIQIGDNDFGVGTNEECGRMNLERSNQVLDDETNKQTISCKNDVACLYVDKQTLHDKTDGVDLDGEKQTLHDKTDGVDLDGDKQTLHDKTDGVDLDGDKQTLHDKTDGVDLDGDKQTLHDKTDGVDLDGDKQTLHDKTDGVDLDVSNKITMTCDVANPFVDGRAINDKDDNNTLDTHTTEDSDTYLDADMQIEDGKCNEPNSDVKCKAGADEQESEKIPKENQTCDDDSLNTQEDFYADSSMGFGDENENDNDSINVSPVGGPETETNISRLENTTTEDSGNHDSCKIT